MSYRHTFYIVEKENLNNITHKEIESYENKEYFSRYDFIEAKGFKEINELGKYSDEGYYLSKSDLIIDYPDFKELRSLLYDEGDTEFYFMKPEALLKVAEMYHERTVKYWEMLLSDEPMETYDSVETDPSKKCFRYVKDLLGWKDFMINTSDNKYTLQTSWKYEYEKYNFLHCYKMIDWDKYYLCLIGG